MASCRSTSSRWQSGRPSPSTIYLVDKSNHLALRTVKTGPRADGLIAIENGLAAGDRVVTADQERLAPGQEVVPQSDLAATK